MPRRRALASRKGGQGKTTNTVTEAAILAARGLRVRIVDCDPQEGSATYWLPPGELVDGADLHGALTGAATFDEATYSTEVPGVDIVPSYASLAGWEANTPSLGEFALRDLIGDGSPYDLTIIDCPPNLGSLTVAALLAAEEVEIPFKSGALDLQGIAEMASQLEVITRHNPGLRVVAIVRTQHRHSQMATAIWEQIRQDWPDAIIHTIRQAVVVGEAPFQHTPLTNYAPVATATEDYRQLVDLLHPETISTRTPTRA